MGALTIEYPPEVLWALQQDPDEFESEARLLLAVKMYEIGKLSTGLAARLAADERRHVLDITSKTAEGRAFVFAGIKDSSGDLTQFAEYIRLCGPGFRALMGRDSLILPGWRTVLQGRLLPRPTWCQSWQ